MGENKPSELFHRLAAARHQHCFRLAQDLRADDAAKLRGVIEDAIQEGASFEQVARRARAAIRVRPTSDRER